MPALGNVAVDSTAMVSCETSIELELFSIVPLTSPLIEHSPPLLHSPVIFHVAAHAESKSVEITTAPARMKLRMFIL
jgi:hypothetical protein